MSQVRALSAEPTLERLITTSHRPGYRTFELGILWAMKKIVIVGCPSSGKTTTGHIIRDTLGIPIHYLDKIFWVKKGGIKQDVFLEKQEEIMRGDSWIIDGGFIKSTSFDVRLEKADTIIFFDMPKAIVYFRLLKRYLKHRGKGRIDMPDGHKEKLDWHLIKFIWNYQSEMVREKVKLQEGKKSVVYIQNPKDERQFAQELLKTGSKVRQ